VFISGQVTIDNGTETAAIQLMAARVVGSADARAELGKATCGLLLLLLSRKRSIYSRRPALSLPIRVIELLMHDRCRCSAASRLHSEIAAVAKTKPVLLLADLHSDPSDSAVLSPVRTQHRQRVLF